MSQVGIFEFEALQYLLKVCDLVKINLAVFVLNVHAQELFCFAQVSAFPLLHNFLFRMEEVLFVGS